MIGEQIPLPFYEFNCVVRFMPPFYSDNAKNAVGRVITWDKNFVWVEWQRIYGGYHEPMPLPHFTVRLA